MSLTVKNDKKIIYKQRSHGNKYRGKLVGDYGGGRA